MQYAFQAPVRVGLSIPNWAPSGLKLRQKGTKQHDGNDLFDWSSTINVANLLNMFDPAPC